VERSKAVTPAASDGKNNKNANSNCGSTDPAEDASQHSLDDSVNGSVKSFGSTHSKKSASKEHANASEAKPGNSSGGSMPPRRDSGSQRSVGDHSSGGSVGSKHNPKSLAHSSSVIGLDSMIENRREGGGLTSNMVHMEVPFGKPIEEVYDGVHSGPVLGSGISGLVRLVTHKATGVKYAVKVLDLGLVDTSDGLAQLREEIFIMCQLDHPNIVRLEEVYESHSEIYLVQELCLGGELFDRLDEQPDYHYTESECARLVKQMLCAVRYLHSKGIIHRDLKLENFLFSSTSQDSELKMIDFGLSKHFRYGEVQHQAVGTPYTVAPEVIRGSYDERCDIWAIGVIAFLLFSGEPPFGGCGGPEPLSTVRANILAGDYGFEPEDIWEVVSTGGKDFIREMLIVDPKVRPTARDAQHHHWLKEWADRSRGDDDNVLNPNVVKALVNFKEFSDMRKLLCEVLSFTLLPDQILELRRDFELLDTDGSGEISLAALKEVLVTNAGAGSLGGLTEAEVEDIFNAMRVNKTVTRIHWHEFIAAGLSQCQVDDRNLRLAFERLDGNHKGVSRL
jgi:calcium-dependent protein kinase